MLPIGYISHSGALLSDFFRKYIGHVQGAGRRTGVIVIVVCAMYMELPDLLHIFATTPLWSLRFYGCWLLSGLFKHGGSKHTAVCSGFAVFCYVLERIVDKVSGAWFRTGG